MSNADRELIFAALADSHRRLLLDRLRMANGQTLRQLCSGHEITRQAVTKHLAVLEEAGLLVTRRQGRQKLHFLNPVPINAVAMRWLKQFDRVRLEALFKLPDGDGGAG
jgi:DNA-binding transcriptional ArsR family regulator